LLFGKIAKQEGRGQGTTFKRMTAMEGGMEVPRLGVESELQLPAYTTAPAMPVPCHICDLHHSSR